MRRNIIITLCILVIVIFSTSTYKLCISPNHSDTATVCKSLTEYFFDSNSSAYAQYIYASNNTLTFNYYEISVDEYILDKPTGIGFLCCHMDKAIYEKYQGSIAPYIKESNLLSYNLSTIEIENTVYLYYSFVLNKQTTEHNTCFIYFNRTDTTQNFELHFTNTDNKTLTLSDNCNVTVSPFGCKITDLNSMNYMNAKINELNYNDIFSGIHVNRNNEDCYAIYTFKMPTNISNITTLYVLNICLNK